MSASEPPGSNSHPASHRPSGPDENVSLVSVVVPCYNEEDVLGELYRRLSRAVDSWEEAAEIVLVDDGSTDTTWSKMEAIRQKDSRWRIVRFSRNFGHQTAVSAGLRYAAGSAVIVMDADLQDPPEELRRFISKWKDGYEVVYSVRRHRKRGTLKRVAYKTFYRLLSGLSNHDIPLDSGDFCLMDRTVVDLINRMPEKTGLCVGFGRGPGFERRESSMSGGSGLGESQSIQGRSF